MMPCLLVLAGDGSDLHRLRDDYSSQYRFAAGSNPLLVDDVDLFVVEAAVLPHHARSLQTVKDRSAPGFMPVLAVAVDDSTTWTHLTGYMGTLVDAVLVMPFTPKIFELNVHNLLSRRNLMQQLLDQARSLSRINMALESISDAISISDQTGTIIYENQSFFDLYGFDDEDLTQGGIEHTLFADDVVADEVSTSLERGDSWQGEVDLRRKDDFIVPAFLRANPLQDENGSDIGAIYVYRDITDRRRAEAVEQEQQIFADALRDTATALTSTLDLNAVLDQMLISIQRVVPHDLASIMLLKDGIVSMVRSHGHEALGIDLNKMQAAMPELAEVAGLRWMAESGQPLIVSDAYAYAGWFGKTNLPWLRSYMGVPIRLKGVTLGFLNVSSMQRAVFDVAQATRLQLFADQAAIALQNAQLHEKALAFTAIQARQRLARELHDGVNQMLFSASMISESLLYLSRRDPENFQQRLAHLHRLTRGALVQMRMLLAELRPEELIEARLSDLVRQLADALQSRTQLQVHLETEGDYRHPDPVQVAFYYIALELLNNVASHAHATQINIRLISAPQMLELYIRDNGDGVDMDKIAGTQGGISIINDRVSDIGATVDIVSRSDSGTEVTVRWSPSERNAIYGADTANSRTDS
jgi:PAS domain S-box-containing protein